MVKQLDINTIPYPANILGLLEIQDSHELTDAQDQELESWYAKQDMDYLDRWNAAVLKKPVYFDVRR